MKKGLTTVSPFAILHTSTKEQAVRKNYYDLNALMRDSFQNFRTDRTIFNDTDYGYIVMSVVDAETNKPSVIFIAHPVKANTFVKSFHEGTFSTLREAFNHIGIENNS
jgi:formylmethanofuran dehydrogenase subunit D